jgi:hypothetical protein
MTEYSDEWLIERAKVSRQLLEQLPPDMKNNFVLASATLPAMPTSGDRTSAPQVEQESGTQTSQSK